MKLSEIKTDLFTNTCFTDYGIRFQHCDKESALGQGAHISQMWMFTITIHVLKIGGINVNSTNNVNITDEQLKEIMRVSKILQSENNEEHQEIYNGGNKW